MSKRICKNCWQWSEPDYSQKAGKCELGIYKNPYADTDACDDFDDRYPNEEE
jgi:hypothetical protein